MLSYCITEKCNLYRDILLWHSLHLTLKTTHFLCVLSTTKWFLHVLEPEMLTHETWFDSATLSLDGTEQNLFQRADVSGHQKIKCITSKQRLHKNFKGDVFLQWLSIVKCCSDLCWLLQPGIRLAYPEAIVGEILQHHRCLQQTQA